MRSVGDLALFSDLGVSQYSVSFLAWCRGFQTSEAADIVKEAVVIEDEETTIDPLQHWDFVLFDVFAISKIGGISARSEQ